MSAFSCPSCRAPAPADTRRCFACRVTLRLSPAGILEEVFPEVRPGDPIRHFQFPRDALPGGFRNSQQANLTIAPTHDGTMISFLDNVMLPLPDRTVRLRDGCVKATLTPVDAGMNIGLTARSEDLEPKGPGHSYAATAYTARAYLDERRAVIMRTLVFDDSKRSGGHTIREVKGLDLPPVGTRVSVELLVEGPTLVFRMNERTLVTVHDLTYGIGFFGLLLGRHAPRDGLLRRIVCHEFAMAMVSR